MRNLAASPAAPVETCPSGPIVALASFNSNSTSASTQAHSTRCVQIEVGRPQTLIMKIDLKGLADRPRDRDDIEKLETIARLKEQPR